MQDTIVWPPLELTPEERSYCAHYARGDTPGVLRRTYGAELIQTTITGEPSQPTQTVTFSGRRVRLFGISFSGDLDAWAIQLKSPAGTLYTNGFAPVPALLNQQPDLSTFNMIPTFSTSQPTIYLARPGALPMLFDPNIVLEGTDALVIEGQVGAAWITRAANQPYRAVLNCALHVWEFPDAPRERPITGPTGAVTHRKVKT